MIQHSDCNAPSPIRDRGGGGDRGKHTLESGGEHIGRRAVGWNGTEECAVRLVGIRRSLEGKALDAAGSCAAPAAGPDQAASATVPQRSLLLQRVAPLRQGTIIASRIAVDRVGALHGRRSSRRRSHHRPGSRRARHDWGALATAVVEDRAPALAGIPFLVEAARNRTLAPLGRCGMRASAGVEVRGLGLVGERSPRLLGRLIGRAGRLPLRLRLRLRLRRLLDVEVRIGPGGRVQIGGETGQSLGLRLEIHCDDGGERV